MLHSFRTKEGARRRWGYYWYQFFWCMHCGARSKQMLPGTWEPAASPGDESHYWVSTYRDWFKHAMTAAKMRRGTRHCAKKLGERGSSQNVKPSIGTQRVTSPVRQSEASGRKRGDTGVARKSRLQGQSRLL